MIALPLASAPRLPANEERKLLDCLNDCDVSAQDVISPVLEFVAGKPLKDL